ncbi:uncharacterized protein LOC143150651 [Ptiloglossa arizonensis]|uniref:uncharacterized protein LOC143150651 n=1 Tax=Ptiloglossa arizonensis TaxID=3350558 RepID=UPI003F9F5636
MTHPVSMYVVIESRTIKTHETLNVRSVLSDHQTRVRLVSNSKTNMKTVFVVIALCIVGALALTEEQKAKLTEFKGACITETGVDAQVVENAKNGNVDENDEKLACFSSCMLKKIGIMNQDGTVNEEVSRKRAPAHITKEQIDDVINKCKDTTGANDCDKAAKLVKCFKQNKSFTSRRATMNTVAIFIVLFIGSALAAITPDQQAKLIEIKDECMNEIGVDAETLGKALNGTVLENDNKLECFAACVLKKIGIMEDDGSINVDVAREKAPADVPSDDIEDVINKCKDTTGANDCEKAANLVKCFLQNKTFKVLN